MTTGIMDVPQGVRVIPRFTLEVCEGMSLTQAIANADALGGNWTILLYPGTYNEGDITPNGGANITIRGMGTERAVIAPVAAPAVAVIVSGFNLTLENLIVTPPDATRPALRVTGGDCLAISSTLNGVGVGDSIQQVAGALTLDACRVPQDIDLSTAICTLTINYSLLEGPIDTAGFLAHTLTLIGCDFNGQNLVSAATGATTLLMKNCSNVGTISNAGAGAFTIRDSDVATATASSTGTIAIIGGYLNACGGATAAVLWQTGPLRYEVLPNMNIQDSLTAGAGGEVIIHTGAYAPIANLTVAANTLFKGGGKATIITPTGAAITNGIVLNGDNITLKDMKVILAAGAGAGGSRPNVVYATGRTLLCLENLWLVGDATVGDDASIARQNGICFITCTYSKIVNCQSQANKQSGIILHTASNYNTIVGNTCQGNTNDGIFLYDTCSYNTITGNTCQGNTIQGIFLEGCANNAITGNICQGNTLNGIQIHNLMSKYNTITGNTCQGNAVGIVLYGSHYNTVAGNTCQGNTTGATNGGIYIDTGADHNIVIGNICQENDDLGIYCLQSSYNVIAGNRCGGTTGAGDGIRITGDGVGNADYNTITGNVCTGNASNGIAIVGGANANKNIVLGNQLLGNGVALADAGTLTEVAHNITV